MGIPLTLDAHSTPSHGVVDGIPIAYGGGAELLGNRILPGVPIFSPLAGPSRPSWPVTFLEGPSPAAYDHAVGRMSANVYYSTPYSVPSAYLADPQIRHKLLDYSHWLTSNPNREMFFDPINVVTESRPWERYLYLHRPMQPIEFASIFPRLQVDYNKALPVIIYRARIPQVNFWRAGKVEIAGVMLMTNPLWPEVRERAGYSRATLSRILAVIEGRAHSA